MRVALSKHINPAKQNQKRFNKTILIINSLFLMVSSNVFSQQTEPEILGQDIISTESVEYCTSFSSDLNEVYFVRSTDRWGKGKLSTSIFYSIKQDGRWEKPSLAPFSGIFNDSDPHLSRDGKTLYFISTRPSKALIESPDIWVVRRLQDGSWSEAARLPEPINSEKNEFGPITISNGDLFFASDRDGGYGQGDIYKAEQHNEGFLPPTNLGNVINGQKGEWNLEVSDDGDFLIFEASQRTENKSSYGDLYISYKLETGWSIPQNITEINTTGSDLCPELIDMNTTLLFSSSRALRNDWVNIYQIDFKPLLLKYRSSATKE